MDSSPSIPRLVGDALPAEAAHDEPPVFSRSAVTRVLDWLDAQGPLQFLALLYIARWMAIAPVGALADLFVNPSDAEAQVMASLAALPSVTLGIHLLIWSPLIETVLECVIPYAISSRIRRRRDRRAWRFIVVSASVMALFHFMVPAMLFAFITGAFLAYCYAHFAIYSAWGAILVTAAFHAAINVVGLTMILAGL